MRREALLTLRGLIKQIVMELLWYGQIRSLVLRCADWSTLFMLLLTCTRFFYFTDKRDWKLSCYLAKSGKIQWHILQKMFENFIRNFGKLFWSYLYIIFNSTYRLHMRSISSGISIPKKLGIVSNKRFKSSKNLWFKLILFKNSRWSLFIWFNSLKIY